MEVHSYMYHNRGGSISHKILHGYSIYTVVFFMFVLLMLWLQSVLHFGSAHKSTCGSWCICGSIWGLRKGKRHTLSPRLRWYSFPLAMHRILSCTTSLLIITAAVSRRVSLRTLSAEWKGQQSGGCQGVSAWVKSVVPSGIIWRGTNICTDMIMSNRQSLFNWIKGQTFIVTVIVSGRCAYLVISNKSNEHLFPPHCSG